MYLCYFAPPASRPLGHLEFGAPGSQQLAQYVQVKTLKMTLVEEPSRQRVRKKEGGDKCRVVAALRP